jgi:hypothetical protein
LIVHHERDHVRAGDLVGLAGVADDRDGLLTDQRGPEMIPPMARLLRAIGVPALTLLETRLFEARRQRVSAAIKLLAAADPDRLLRGLTRAMASWEWNLQDLAVSELARPANAASAQSTAFVFSAILSDAHPLVVPMMIDQIGIGQETTAVPMLMEIAAGEHETLRDQFVRIKAIEALGRMRAYEAVELLRQLAAKREGLTFVEPAGLRASAEDALAMMEESPASARARAAFEPAAAPLGNFVVPRRYARIPLESPLRAQIADLLHQFRKHVLSVGTEPQKLYPHHGVRLQSPHLSHDANGNILGLPHLPLLAWDHAGRLRAVDLGSVTDGRADMAHYAYDAVFVTSFFISLIGLAILFLFVQNQTSPLHQMSLQPGPPPARSGAAGNPECVVSHPRRETLDPSVCGIPSLQCVVVADYRSVSQENPTSHSCPSWRCLVRNSANPAEKR